MQSTKPILLLGLLLVLVSCNVTPGHLPKPQGWDVGNGGIAFGVEFKDIGRTVVRRLEGKEIREVDGVTVALFKETLEKSKVETTEALLKKGNLPVDALNYPAEMTILLSLVHWANSLDFFEKRRLVIHEILGLMGLEASDQYGRTLKILEALGSSRIYFGQFQVWGDLANTLIEKMPWQSDEMKVSEGSIWYSIPANSLQPDIKCLKVTDGSEVPDRRCWVRKHAYLGEDGVIHVSLCEEDGNHAFWRFFDDIEESRFDYGVIRGNREELLFKLEFFP